MTIYKCSIGGTTITIASIGAMKCTEPISPIGYERIVVENGVVARPGPQDRGAGGVRAPGGDVAVELASPGFGHHGQRHLAVERVGVVEHHDAVGILAERSETSVATRVRPMATPAKQDPLRGRMVDVTA